MSNIIKNKQVIFRNICAYIYKNKHVITINKKRPWEGLEERKERNDVIILKSQKKKKIFNCLLTLAL